MLPAKPQQNNSSEDIDLIKLLEKTVLFFRRFRIAFIIAIFAGILLGSLGYFLIPKIYKSRLILHSAYLTNSEQIEIINYWNELLKRGEYKTLAQILNCSEDSLHELASLEAAEILKVFTPTNPNGFYIDAKVKNNSILNGLQKAIVYGLNNTDFVKRKLEVRKETLKELINKVSIEINKLDSVKISIENIISNKEKNSSSLMLDVSGVNRQLIDMNEKLLSYSEELKFMGSVQVLQGFIPLTTPVSISLKVMILLGLILCLSITYIFSLFSYVKDRLKKRAIANA
ncbi:MAG TPA: hypothetical protein VGQ09_23350 [Chitinophagaceae bacterium]|jgi:hypothetical protein|nr:hypothetical protein [Chitinophagaceae bacterium]